MEAVLQIPLLKGKYDLKTISNSLAILVGDYIEGMILQQFHYWISQEYGVVLEGQRWIYKTIKELSEKAFPLLSPWKVRQAIANLVIKGFLRQEHLFAEHHGDNFHKRNRTYYYRVDYDRIAEMVESLGFVEEQKTDSCNSTELVCDKTQNSTDTIQKEKSKKNTARETAANFNTFSKEESLEATPPTPTTRGTPRKADTPKPTLKSERISPSVNSSSPEEKVIPARSTDEVQSTQRMISALPHSKRQLLGELDQLGITINKDIVKSLESHSLERLKLTLEVFVARRQKNHIPNPYGYWFALLKKDLTQEGKNKPEGKSNFLCWYEMAKKLGQCTEYEERGDDFWVFWGACEWESWRALWSRGWTIAQLHKNLHTAY